MVTYQYDAWGNWINKTKASNGTDLGDTLLLVNPFIYKGYYYDKETDWYYLKSRYYCPKLSRFINMDSTNYLQPGQIDGINLFAYCGNDPVLYNHWHMFGMSSFYPSLLAGRTSSSSSGGEKISSISSSSDWYQTVVGVIPDIILGVRYLLANGIHNKFVYAANSRYIQPIIGGTWRWTGKSGSSLTNFGVLTQGSFRQILTGDAKARFSAITKSVGATVVLNTAVNFGFNLYENNWQVDSDMLKDTAIDTAVGVGAYFMAAGTMSLITAGVVMAGVALPGVIVVGGVIILSMGFEWLIREVTDYHN